MHRFVKRLCTVVFVALSGVALSACATSGPLYKDAKSGYTVLNKDTARLYVYRNVNVFGDAIQPSVLLDGQKIGDARPGGFMTKDIAPGKHMLNVSVETTKTYEFTAKPQEEIYVRLSPGMGWVAARVHIEPVSAQEAAPEIAELHQQTSFAPYDSDTKPSTDKNGH